MQKYTVHSIFWLGVMKLDKKSFFSASFGTLIEYYDYAVLMVFLPIISPLFFPAATAYDSLVKGFYTMLIAMIARPLGALFFGYLGDSFGRRRALLSSVYGIAIATILMGLTPTAESIGIWAAIMLAFTKAVQVFCFGGEYNGAGIYVVELAQNKREGLVGSILTAMMLVGSLVATLIGYLISLDGMPSWSWRAAIIFGGILGIIAISSRKTLIESPNFEKSNPKRHSLIALLKNYPLQILAGVFVGGFATVPFTTVIIFLNPVLITKGILEAKSVMLFQSAVLVVEIATLILAGFFADKRSPSSIMSFAAILLAFISFPLLKLVDQHDRFLIIGVEVCFIIVNALLLGPSNAYLKNLFPMQFRYRGASLGFTLGLSLFGGLTPIVENWLYAQANSFAAISPWLIFVALGTFLSLKLASAKNIQVLE